MLRTHVNNDIYNIYCLIHNTPLHSESNFGHSECIRVKVKYAQAKYAQSPTGGFGATCFASA